MCTEGARECLSIAIFVLGSLWILGGTLCAGWLVRQARRSTQVVKDAELDAELRALKAERRAVFVEEATERLITQVAELADRLKESDR